MIVPLSAAHPAVVATCLSVRFQAGEWRIEGDPTLDDLSFANPMDAQRLAMGLARRRGGAVQIYDRSNRLLQAYL